MRPADDPDSHRHHERGGVRDEASRALQDYSTALAAGQLNEASLAAAQFLRCAGRDLKTREPTPYSVARDEAFRREGALDWDGAQAAWRQVVLVGETAGAIGWQYDGHENLCRLHGYFGRDQSALQEARAASGAQKHGHPLIYASALESEAICALAVQDIDGASSTADSLRKLLTDKPLSRAPYARAIILQARCALASGDVSTTESLLTEAWAILEPMSRPSILAGNHVGLAAWWGAKAALSEAQGHTVRVVEALEQALAQRRHVAQLPQMRGPYGNRCQVAIGTVLRRLGGALRDAGDEVSAQQRMEESRFIRLTLNLPWLDED